MNILIIFLVIVLLACLIFSTYKIKKESFTSCKTLRCENNKYSLSSLKNNSTAKIANLASPHINFIKSHWSNLKERFL